MKPLFSIITATYNAATTLPDTLRSVAGQAYPAVEHLIIDGQSTDDTLDVVRKYGPHVAHVVSQPDQGLYDAMNKGIALATGEIIGILNADDVYAHPQVLAHVAAAFAEDASLEAVYGNLDFVSGNLQKVLRRWRSRPFDATFFEQGEMPPHPTLFVKKSVYSRIGAFNLRYRFGADYEFTLRAMRVHGIRSHWLNETLILMRMGGTTTGSISNILRNNQECIRAWKDNGLRVPLSYFIGKISHRTRQFF